MSEEELLRASFPSFVGAHAHDPEWSPAKRCLESMAEAPAEEGHPLSPNLKSNPRVLVRSGWLQTDVHLGMILLQHTVKVKGKQGH